MVSSEFDRGKANKSCINKIKENLKYKNEPLFEVGKPKTFSVQGIKGGVQNQDELRFFRAPFFFQGNFPQNIFSWKFPEDFHLHSSQMSLSFDEFR